MNYKYNKKGIESGNPKVLYRKHYFFLHCRKEIVFYKPYLQTLIILYDILNESAALVTLMRSWLQLLEDHRFRWSYTYYVHLCIIPLVLEYNHFVRLSLFSRMRFGLFSSYIRNLQ